MTGDAGELRLRAGAAEWLEQDGEAVLLDLDRAWYLGLNRSATMLWSELAAGTTRARLVQRLRAGYGLDDTQAASDVDVFLAECDRRGLLADHG